MSHSNQRIIARIQGIVEDRIKLWRWQMRIFFCATWITTRYSGGFLSAEFGIEACRTSMRADTSARSLHVFLIALVSTLLYPARSFAKS